MIPPCNTTTKDAFAQEYAKAVAQVEAHNEPFRKDLIELLKKHELTALVAVDRLTAFCDEILCHFNTRDLTPFTYPIETELRVDARKQLSRQGTSWGEVLRAGKGVLHQDVGAHLDCDG